MGTPEDLIREMTAEITRLGDLIGQKAALIEEHLREQAGLERRKSHLEQALLAYQSDELGPLPPHIKYRPLANMGFREAIREVLKRGSPMKPAEVVKQLENGGFDKLTGTTSVSLRVNNELFKMFKGGLLARDKKGYYLKD